MTCGVVASAGLLVVHEESSYTPHSGILRLTCGFVCTCCVLEQSDAVVGYFFLVCALGFTAILEICTNFPSILVTGTNSVHRIHA